MKFELDEDQREFRALLRSFVDKEVIPVAREWEQAGRYPTEIVEGMAAMGLFGITVPEEYGGLDLDPVSFALVFEELARGWMGVAGILGSHSLACRMIAMHGTEEQKQKYLPDLATGVRRTGIGLTEPDAGTDLQGIRTTARLDGDEYVVNGNKMWITNARYANPLPVLVKTDPSASPAHQGMSVLLVDADTPGYEVTRDIPKLGYKGTESCEVLLDNARVPVVRAARRRRGQGHAAGAVGARVGPGQHRGALGRHRATRLRRGARVLAPTQGVRPADRGLPGDPAQARHHGHDPPGRAADGLLGRRLRGQSVAPTRRPGWPRSSAPRSPSRPRSTR